MVSDVILKNLVTSYASGGDGSSSKSPVVITCASVPVANKVIDAFISLKHGERGKDWERSLEASIKPNQISSCIRAIAVKVLADNSSAGYYFDLTRPMKGSAILAQAMKQVPQRKAKKDIGPYGYGLLMMPFLISSGMLLLAPALDWPYAYFQILRVIVFMTSLFSMYCTYKDQRFFWIFVGSAILFNPIARIHLAREVWSVIDVAFGSVFLCASFFVYKCFNGKSG